MCFNLIIGEEDTPFQVIECKVEAPSVTSLSSRDPNALTPRDLSKPVSEVSAHRHSIRSAPSTTYRAATYFSSQSPVLSPTVTSLQAPASNTYSIQLLYSCQMLGLCG